MDKNLIKKELYKQKPVATKLGQGDMVEAYITGKTSSLVDSGVGDMFYETELKLGERDYKIFFCIPENELKDTEGNVLFGSKEPAQLLIRWIGI